MTPDQQARFDHAAQIAPTPEGADQLVRLAAEVAFGLFSATTVH
mgnify:CR=1 FL=1